MANRSKALGSWTMELRQLELSKVREIGAFEGFRGGVCCYYY